MVAGKIEINCAINDTHIHDYKRLMDSSRGLKCKAIFKIISNELKIYAKYFAKCVKVLQAHSRPNTSTFLKKC